MRTNCNTKDVRVSASETMLMTTMVAFAPVMLCTMMLLASVL